MADFRTQQTRINPGESGPVPDRTKFRATDVVKEVWSGLGLPRETLSKLHLPADEPAEPAVASSFKIGTIAQSSIALSLLAAAQLRALHEQGAVRHVEAPLEHAVIIYRSESLYTIDGQTPYVANPRALPSVGGLHETADGHVRIHDSFPNHSNGILELVGLPLNATRQQLAAKLKDWKSVQLETAATAESNLAVYALRTYQEWDALPQSQAISNFPIDVTRLPSNGLKRGLTAGTGSLRCLQGLRVVEMSRVIAAPLSGKTLASHGADVIWVTSPQLPDIPALDRELSRGKRTVQLHIHDKQDKAKLVELLRTCDVFIQGYRPGSLASYGLSPEELVKINPNIIIANMSAFGPRGPWSQRRGFDSLVQTCSGMNVSEAEHAGKGEAARPMPCQALDHSAGYLLATGIMAALYHRATQGGAWQVDVSLAGVMKYLRSLGQHPGDSGFRRRDYAKQDDVPAEYFETTDTVFGKMRSVRCIGTIEGCNVGWTLLPRRRGADTPEWLS